ncbi:MAG TPA: hypothetical protein PLZ84_01670 [Clostridia bacterium]|nr:hypothetical protein [Clostridia bacterium]
MKNIIDLSHYLPKDNTMDATPAVVKALEDARGIKNPMLVFPAGTWHFWPTRASEKFYYISNNDNGIKRILFHIINYSDITIDGNGAELIFHGRIIPFVIDNSRNVTIKKFKIDYIHPFYTQGKVVASGKDFVDLEIDYNRYLGHSEGNRLVFYSDEVPYEPEDGLYMLEFDAEKNEPAYGKSPTFARQGKNNELFFTRESPVLTTSQTGNRLRMNFEFFCRPDVGNNLHINLERRLCPGIFITQSANIAIEDMRIYHTLAMALIAQVSSDITLRRVHIGVREGSGDTVSANADATHFLHCTGHILMEDCIFKNMMDDATNIHGMYTKITGVPTDNQIEVGFGHFQQVGVPIYSPGDRIAFVDKRSFAYTGDAIITAVKVINASYVLLTLDRNIRALASPDCVVDLPDKTPSVTLRRIRTGKNRSRGFLISTNKKVLIEDCEFHNSCQAIHLTGDANSWHESGPVNDLTIRNCVFNDVGYERSLPPIEAWPEISADTAPPFHKNIHIENNRFIVNSSVLIKARHCANITGRNNTYAKSKAYPFTRLDKPMLELYNCSNVTIDEIVEGKR